MNKFYLNRCQTLKTTWKADDNYALTECIGEINGECRLQFLTKLRAQIYCESNEKCLGIRKTNCVNHEFDLYDCDEWRWIPFKVI